MILYQMDILELCSKQDLCFLFRSENSFIDCYRISYRVECEVAVLNLNTGGRKVTTFKKEGKKYLPLSLFLPTKL